MDHVPIEREPDAPARRTKAETLRQIGDRLRQVNGDGPCNPPDLVLALDLLIDAHNETLRECETLRAAVAYRPGMPSSKQVRAHEARGGWWQFLYEGEEGPCMVKLRWEDHDGDASLIVGRHAGRIEFSRVSPPSSCRPVTFPDGTPCPWLAAPLDPAADNAQGGAPAKVSPRDIWRAPTLVNWCLLGGDSSEDPEEAARADALARCLEQMPAWVELPDMVAALLQMRLGEQRKILALRDELELEVSTGREPQLRPAAEQEVAQERQFWCGLARQFDAGPVAAEAWADLALGLSGQWNGCGGDGDRRVGHCGTGLEIGRAHV